MATFQFALVTPAQVIFEGEVRQVSLRSEGGDITFMPLHAPFIGKVTFCPVKILDADGAEIVVAVDGGFIRTANNRVSVVTPSADLVAHLTNDDVAIRRATAQAAFDADPTMVNEDALTAADLRVALLGG